MTMHPIASREDWTAARLALLAKEKEFTRARDALSAARRELPWEKVETDYVFEGAKGAASFADLGYQRHLRPRYLVISLLQLHRHQREWRVSPSQAFCRSHLVDCAADLSDRDYQ